MSTYDYVSFQVHDRVRLTRTLAGSFPNDDPELSVDPYDARTHYRVPVGALGTVVKARGYPTPFPYVVLFDDGTELSVATGDLERMASRA